MILELDDLDEKLEQIIEDLSLIKDKLGIKDTEEEIEDVSD